MFHSGGDQVMPPRKHINHELQKLGHLSLSWRHRFSTGDYQLVSYRTQIWKSFPNLCWMFSSCFAPVSVALFYFLLAWSISFCWTLLLFIEMLRDPLCFRLALEKWIPLSAEREIIPSGMVLTAASWKFSTCQLCHNLEGFPLNINKPPLPLQLG